MIMTNAILIGQLFLLYLALFRLISYIKTKLSIPNLRSFIEISTAGKMLFVHNLSIEPHLKIKIIAL